MVKSTKGGAGKLRASPLPAMPAMPKTAKARERKWAAESALGTLTRAKEIECDARLMADVKKLADEQAMKMASIAKTIAKK